jgi:hypothetical protein
MGGPTDSSDRPATTRLTHQVNGMGEFGGGAIVTPPFLPCHVKCTSTPIIHTIRCSDDVGRSLENSPSSCRFPKFAPFSIVVPTPTTLEEQTQHRHFHHSTFHLPLPCSQYPTYERIVRMAVRRMLLKGHTTKEYPQVFTDRR